LIIVELRERDRVFGAISFLTTEASGRRFSREDFALAKDLAQRAAVSLENARLFQERSHVARTLQRSLLPPVLPDVPGVQIAARYEPAGEGNEVGGDFYDVFRSGRRRWDFVIGDVCGKGADAAAVTGLARHTVRAVALQRREPCEVLGFLNSAILEQQDDDRFCTVALASLEPNGVTSRLVLSSGGHPPPLLLRPDGSVTELGEPGVPLGVFKNISLTDTEVELRPGDAVILYTDGVTDARNQIDIFGDERLKQSAARAAGRDASGIAAAIYEDVTNFQSGPSVDDIALLVFKIEIVT
jgi:serine phosphatase RsbU (regulator of sigma subunit)